MKTLVRQTNFASGELGTNLTGRTDLSRYRNGAKTMVNWLPLAQGGATRFPGTRWIEQTWGETRLEAVEYAAGKVFLFVFQFQRIKIYYNGALHQTLGPSDIPYNANEIWELDVCQALDTIIIVHEDHPPKSLVRGVGDVFTIADISFSNVPQEGGIAVWHPSRGYPRSCCFHENRLVMGGSKTYPDRVWLSRSGNFYDFDTSSPTLDDNGIQRQLLADSYEQVQWVFSQRRLLVGTTIGEWATEQTDPITPSNFTLLKQTSIGSARVRPVSIDGAVIHVTREGDQLRQLVWNDLEIAFTTSSLSILSPLAINGCRQLAVKTARDNDDANLLLAVNTNGVLGVCNLIRDQEFVAWVRRTCDGNFKSAASAGGEIYFMIEFFNGPGVFEDDVFEDGVFAESGAVDTHCLVQWDDTLLFDLATTTTISPAGTTFGGFDHLIGTTVEAYLDGNYIGEVEVDESGDITTADTGLSLTAGVRIPTPTLEPMPYLLVGQAGSMALIPKRKSKCLVQFLETQGCEIDGYTVNFRDAGDSVFAPVEEYTGTKEVRLLGWSREPTITITAQDAVKCTILALDVEIGA